MSPTGSATESEAEECFSESFEIEIVCQVPVFTILNGQQTLSSFSPLLFPWFCLSVPPLSWQCALFVRQNICRVLEPQAELCCIHIVAISMYICLSLSFYLSLCWCSKVKLLKDALEGPLGAAEGNFVCLQIVKILRLRDSTTRLPTAETEKSINAEWKYELCVCHDTHTYTHTQYTQLQLHSFLLLGQSSNATLTSGTYPLSRPLATHPSSNIFKHFCVNFVCSFDFSFLVFSSFFFWLFWRIIFYGQPTRIWRPTVTGHSDRIRYASSLSWCCTARCMKICCGLAANSNNNNSNLQCNNKLVNQRAAQMCCQINV